MNADFNASAVSAGALISTNTFAIPRFQREYAWTKEELTEFWEDLRRSLGERSYFLGLVILTGESGRKSVVDGQQRLISISLLAAALEAEARAIGRSALADSIRSDFLRSIDYETDETSPRIKLSDAQDDGTFQLIVGAGDLSAVPDDPDSVSSLLIQAFRFLSDQLHADLATDPFKRLGTWAEFLSNRLEFAVFVHPDPASAYRVFEVINTRGRELTTADLLKNYLLGQAPASQQQGLYERWQAVARSFSVTGAGTFVQFIRHVATVRAGHIPPKELFDYLAQRKPATTPAPSAAQLLNLLEQHLPLYLQMVDPTLPGPADQDALRVFAALNELGVVAVRPLLLALPGTETEASGREAVLDLVVRRVVVGNLGTGNVERRLGEAAFAVYQDRSWNAALAQLRDLDPPPAQFRYQTQRRSLGKVIVQFLRRSIVQQTKTPDPTGWLHYIRPRQGGDWDGFVAEDLLYWGSTIGNTVLLSEERRPLGATTWDGVREHLFPLAVGGEWTGRLTAYESWGATQVEEVGEALAEAAVATWYQT